MFFNLLLFLNNVCRDEVDECQFRHSLDPNISKAAGEPTKETNVQCFRLEKSILKLVVPCYPRKDVPCLMTIKAKIRIPHLIEVR